MHKGPGHCVRRPVFWQNMWFMINLFLSSIEIELINELFYLKIKRVRSVFRMTLRLRTGYRLRCVWTPFWGCCTLTQLCWLTDWDDRRGRDMKNLIGNATQSSWTTGSLRRSWLFHPQAGMPLHATVTMCCWGWEVGRGAPPFSSPWRNLQLSKQISASIWNKRLGPAWLIRSACLAWTSGQISSAECQWAVWPNRGVPGHIGWAQSKQRSALVRRMFNMFRCSLATVLNSPLSRVDLVLH